MIRLILVLLFIGLYLLLGIPILLIEWLIAKNPHWKYAADISQLRMVQWAFRVICFLSGVKLTVIGEENVPKDSPVLYIGNHRSFFDIVITYARCPGLTGYVAKDSITRFPLLSTWMRRLHCLFLNRSDLKEGLKTILQGIEYVKSGISICIFPEGSRSLGESELDLLPFKQGSLKIAEKSGCPIIPMAITGTADIFEKHLPFIHSSKVILQYGEPIIPTQLSKEERKKLGSYAQSKIEQMLQEHTSM